MAMTDEAIDKAEETEAERPAVEVLPAKEEPGRSPADSALERAAEAALAQPGIPGRDEFLALAATARMLSMSGAAPLAVRNNPHLAFHIALVGRDLGISPSAALALVDVIDTKKGPQLSLSPELMNGQIARLGLGRIVPAVKERDRCVAVALRPGGSVDVRCARRWPDHVDGCSCAGVLGESEFTWADAQDAGLAGVECQPGVHKKKERQGRNDSTYEACGCNTGYRNYPRRMMWWRAAGFAADDYFPEASLGLYSPEELGAMVDEEGRALDPATVELPEGYMPALPPPPEPARVEDVEELRRRVKAFWPSEQARTIWVEMWNNRREDGTEVREGAEPLPHIRDLTARQVPRAKAVVGFVENGIRSGQIAAPPNVPEAGETAQERQEAPAEAPEAPGQPEADQEPETAAEDPEDGEAEAAIEGIHARVWSIHLADARAELTALGLDPAGKPAEVRNRLESELVRRHLAGEVAKIEAGSLIDALAELTEGE